jgi:hypothetical protein
MILTLKQEFLKIYASLQTAFAAAAHLADGQWVQNQVNMLKLTHVPSRNPKAGYFGGRRATFSANKHVYLE